MAHIVIIENKAQKEFVHLPAASGALIKKAIDKLANEPRPHSVKKLSGTKDGYRIRIGDYRVLYTIDDRKKVITIYRIRHRKEVYE